MTTITRLILITHPQAYHSFVGQAWARPWIEHEVKTTRAWWDAMAAFPRDAVAAIVGCYPHNPGPMEEVCRRATEILGPRCVALREPDYLHPDFWAGLSREEEAALLDDLKQACLTQRDAWNKEEMETFFHSRRCVARLSRELASRDFRIDPARTRLEGWGVEYEGCTAKYTLAFRELLGLRESASLEFDRCTPGARFMLAARNASRTELACRVTLHTYDTHHGPAALYVDHTGTLRHPARSLRLPIALRGCTVRTKQGGRLWPEPRLDRRRTGPHGVHEINQPLVRIDADAFVVPVCTGMIYRLAKAPAYLFAPKGMGRDEFESLLREARD